MLPTLYSSAVCSNLTTHIAKSSRLLISHSTPVLTVYHHWGSKEPCWRWEQRQMRTLLVQLRINTENWCEVCPPLSKTFKFHLHFSHGFFCYLSAFVEERIWRYKMSLIYFCSSLKCSIAESQRAAWRRREQRHMRSLLCQFRVKTGNKSNICR